MIPSLLGVVAFQWITQGVRTRWIVQSAEIHHFEHADQTLVSQASDIP